MIHKQKCPSHQNFASTCDSSSKKKQQKQRPYRFFAAEEQLSENFIPSQILCRTKQMKKIKNFIQDFIFNGFSKESLYISGVPGIGKTLSVTKVFEQFQEKTDQMKKNKLKIIKLNAMNLKNPQDLYKAIYIDLLPQKLRSKTKISTQEAKIKLDDLFRGTLMAKQQQQLMVQSKKLLLLDEIDYLKTNKQQVLYNIFDWVQSQQSKFAIIAISNTIDFPQRLQQKILSRIGNCRIVFQPYNSNDLYKILLQRIEQTYVFDLTALQATCKRISKTTSDLRKCLQILRSAIFVHIKDKPINQLKYSKITNNEVNIAYQEIYGDHIPQSFKLMPKSYQQILVILAYHFTRNTRSLPIDLICKTASNRYNLQCYNVKQTLFNLMDLGLIELKYGLNSFCSFKNMTKYTIKLLPTSDRIMAAALKYNENLIDQLKNIQQRKN